MTLFFTLLGVGTFTAGLGKVIGWLDQPGRR